MKKLYLNITKTTFFSAILEKLTNFSLCEITLNLKQKIHTHTHLHNIYINAIYIHLKKDIPGDILRRYKRLSYAYHQTI